MSETAVVLTLKKGRTVTKIEGTRVAFSPGQCFAFDGSQEEVECLRALGEYLKTRPGLALVGPQHFIDYLFRHVPGLQPGIVQTVVTPDMSHRPMANPVKKLPELLPTVMNVFVCEPAAFPRMELRKALPPGIGSFDLTIIADIAPESIPARGWVSLPKNIYPIDVPRIELKPGLDLVLLDCPSRNLALMPNGLAYVNNALKKTSVSFQIFDLDIIAYHRFHIHRLYDAGGRIVLPGGRALPEDPWQAEHYDVWASGAEHASSREGSNEVLDFFRSLIEEAVEAIVEARPRILGLSIQQCNEAISREVVRGVKAKLPDTVILVGGFSCYNADIGRRAFPECDYMCIGEADLTVGFLVEALARGERPFNQPGVLSRYDTADYTFIPAPMVHNLDQIEFPKYEWCDLGVYRNYNDYQLTPIIASRGCRWSRCTFCAERFYWRIRSPQNFVDELEWLVNQGCHLYMFNESDLNGMPERVMEICDEIIRRGLHRKVKLTGQLRIHKKSSRAFFQKLREANFVALRFGVDAFSQNTLRLQKKGYTVDMICQNLEDCWEAGIYTEVNWVIGVPGETDADVEEGIELILKNRKYIGRLANINPLILVNGGVYWIDPDAHNVVFKEPKEQLYAKFPRALPADMWYSTNPYIDAQVRKERFERIVLALHDAGFPVGAWANRVIEDVKLARDPNRAAAAKQASGATEAPEEKQALEAISQLGPTEETADDGSRKVIPIRSVTEGKETSESGKPAAEPPLFGVAGAPPRLVRKMETHDVVFYNGWHYGVPHALGNVDLTRTDAANLTGVVRHATEEGVVAIIEEASRWANTRGQYDSQEKQRVAGSYMRAGSALGEMELSEVPQKPKILRIHNAHFAISQQTLEEAFTMPRLGLRGPFAMESDGPDSTVEIEARSPLRRIAAKLPPAFRQEIRRLIRLRSLETSAASGPLTTQPDGRLLTMLWRGAVDAYMRKPLARILKGSSTEQGRPVQEGIPVEGEDFVVLSVVTKNALPELMWSIGRYNLVKFDGLFYGLPHGVPIDWDAGDVASIPGVFVGKTTREVVAMIEATQQIKVKASETVRQTTAATGPAGKATRAPTLLGSLENYNIVSYEGWIYGLPQDLGPIDLTEVDAIDMPGVIRDVSQDVVENEILDRVKTKQQVAA